MSTHTVKINNPAPRCKSRECNVIEANAGVFSDIPYWYCRDCKVEVKHPEIRENFTVYGGSNTTVRAFDDGVNYDEDEVAQLNKILKSMSPDSFKKVTRTPILPELEPNPCAPRNKDWNTKPVNDSADVYEEMIKHMANVFPDSADSHALDCHAATFGFTRPLQPGSGVYDVFGYEVMPDSEFRKYVLSEAGLKQNAKLNLQHVDELTTRLTTLLSSFVGRELNDSGIRDIAQLSDEVIKKYFKELDDES